MSTNPTISGDLIPITGEGENYQQNFNLIYAGDSGSGKTTCMASWPNPLFLYADKNVGALKKYGVPYVPVRDWNLLDKQVIPMLKAREWPDATGERVPFPYRTIVLDTFSSIGDACYDYHAKLWGEAKEKSFKFWDKMLGDQMRVVRAINELTVPKGGHPGCHVLFGCHVKDKENEQGRVVKTQLDIWGKAAINIVKSFDDILLCDKETNKELEEEFWCWTVNPPNTKIKFVKEIMKGPGGENLPPKVDGSYQSLMKLWGVNEDD